MKTNWFCKKCQPISLTAAVSHAGGGAEGLAADEHVAAALVLGLGQDLERGVLQLVGDVLVVGEPAPSGDDGVDAGVVLAGVLGDADGPGLGAELDVGVELEDGDVVVGEGVVGVVDHPLDAEGLGLVGSVAQAVLADDDLDVAQSGPCEINMFLGCVF